MKTTDLRIGNLVLSKGVPVQIEEIMWETVRYCFGEFPIDYVEPIPLTEEWLLKFGFVSNPYEDRYEKGTIHIECDKTKGATYLWVENMPHIKYVHQLQNLYFALTGEELTKGGEQ
jgi:hypothetical protein